MRLETLAFAAGVLLLQCQPELLELGAVWLLALVPVLAARRWRQPPLRLAAILACGLLGFGYAGWRAESRLADELPLVWEGRDIEVSGVVAGLPQDFGQGYRFEFAVDGVSTASARVPARLMLSWYRGRRDGEAADPQPVLPGERWRFTVRLKRPHGNANPGAFDYEAWLLERGLRATGYVRPEQPQRLDDFVWAPAYVVERLRYRIRQRFSELLPADAYPLAGVLVALTIGDQKAVQVVI